MSPAGFWWHIFKPLLGLNLRRTFAESIVAPKNAGRLVATGEFAIVVLVQVTILGTVTGFGRHPVLVALPIVSAATFGLFFSQLRGIAEHGAVGEDAETRNVRSHIASWVDRMFLYDVNFNYHREHHENPQIPSCHLPAVFQTAGIPATTGSMFGTLRAIYAGRKTSHV